MIREEGLIERGRGIGTRLHEGLEAIRRRTDRLREVRGRGLMLAVELEDDHECRRTARVQRELVARGFVVGRRPGVGVLRLDPPLTTENGDIEAFLRAFEETLLAD